MRGTQLKKLDISYCCSGDVGIAALGNLLSSSSMHTLETLEMNHMNTHVTSQGWVSFFNNALQNSNLNLVVLNLESNQIDDNGMQLLVQLSSSITSLSHLNLDKNRLVTPTGWQGLTGYLQSPNFALEYLDLDGNKINDDVVVAFTSALSQNKTLIRISLYDCRDEDDLITERGWTAVSTLLCNKSSIMDTYNSNHTIQDVCYEGYDEMDHPGDLVSLLELNRNKNKVEVARQKILQSHLTDDDGASKIQELLDMELENMPAVVAWIGRPTVANWKGTNVSGLSLLYNLMRRLPDLFDSIPQKKSSMGKRKRGVCPNYA